MNKDIKNPDVVIVGAGPAGLSAAEVIASKGTKVLILEKNLGIGINIRTSGGSWIEELKALNIPETFYHPIRRCRFLFPNKEVVFKYETPTLCVINVRALYQFLAEKAILAGAEIKLNTIVEKPVKNNENITSILCKSRIGSQEIGANLFIDASGSNAVIARGAGFYDKLERFAIGAEYEFFSPSYDKDEVILAVGNNIAPSGYGWAFPCGGQRVRVGVGIIRPVSLANPSDYLDIFIDYLYLKKILGGAQPLEFHTGIIPVDGVKGSFVQNNLLVIGDAAGQASALVGEGIRFAIEAGRMAGNIAAKAISINDTSKSFLYQYEKEWRTKYERKMALAFEINKRMATYTNNEWDERADWLSILNPNQFAEVLKSNFTISWLIGVLLKNPSLIKKAPSLVRHIKKSKLRNKKFE